MTLHVHNHKERMNSMIPARNNPGGDSGMTLVELLIATVIAMILVYGAFQFFVIQTRNFNEGRTTSEMQQELRWAMKYVTDRVRLTGNGVPPSAGFRIIDNFDGGSSYSDSLCILSSFKSLVVSTTQAMGNLGSQIKVSSSEGIEDYDLIVISYPPNGWQEVFMSTKMASDLHIYHDAYPPWNPTNKLQHKYPSGSIVSVVSHFSFFVKVDDEGRSNLMVLTQGPYGAMILAGDIDNFQVRFKLKSGDWVDVPDVISDIRMVEITLREMSPEPLDGYIDPVFGDAYKRIELHSLVIPKNITIVAE